MPSTTALCWEVGVKGPHHHELGGSPSKHCLPGGDELHPAGWFTQQWTFVLPIFGSPSPLVRCLQKQPTPALRSWIQLKRAQLCSRFVGWLLFTFLWNNDKASVLQKACEIQIRTWCCYMAALQSWASNQFIQKCPKKASSDVDVALNQLYHALSTVMVESQNHRTVLLEGPIHSFQCSVGWVTPPAAQSPSIASPPPGMGHLHLCRAVPGPHCLWGKNSTFIPDPNLPSFSLKPFSLVLSARFLTLLRKVSLNWLWWGREWGGGLTRGESSGRCQHRQLRPSTQEHWGTRHHWQSAQHHALPTSPRAGAASPTVQVGAPEGTTEFAAGCPHLQRNAMKINCAK